MMNRMKTAHADVCATIVTYNRKELLAELLSALRRQTHPVKTVVIVDNHSSDGTPELLKERGIIARTEPDIVHINSLEGTAVHYYRSSANTGGAGGFEQAFRIAMRTEHDFIWAMDDDVEPEEDCLEKLLQAVSDTAQVCIPNRSGNGWTEPVVKEYDLSNPFLVNVRRFKKAFASSRVEGGTEKVADIAMEGPLISTEIIRKAGVPDGNYFLFFDDSDYAQRLLRHTTINFVKDARLHRKIAKTGKSAAPWRHYYFNRNAFYFDRRYGKNVLVRHFRPFLSCHSRMLLALLRGRPDRARLLRRAYRDAVRGRMGKQIEPGETVIC